MSNCRRPLRGELFAFTYRTDLALIKDQIVSLMIARGCAPADLFGVSLALEEALTNAAVHGNADDPSKQIRVSYRFSADEVECEVEDEGSGFDSADVPDPRLPEHLDRPHGRGLLVMRTYMTEIQHNKNGNCVTMRRRFCESEAVKSA